LYGKKHACTNLEIRGITVARFPCVQAPSLQAGGIQGKGEYGTA